MTRRVMVFKWRDRGRVEVGAGNFHQFGTDCEEFEDGGFSFSTAIVEMRDGNVVNVLVELIRFDD